jgi:septum formation topological specificity factor MinE
MPGGGMVAIKDCALAAIATQKRAQNLRELRDNILTIHPGSIYYHFWGCLLRPRFDDPEYHNDFAIWAHNGLYDEKLAERLGIIDPTDFSNMEELRQELVEVIEERLEESEMIPWSKADHQFHFTRSQVVVFDTHRRIEDPEELVSVIPGMSVSSIFYHFVDARRRSMDNADDMHAWLAGFGETYEGLRDRLAAVDTYFSSLHELREELTLVITTYFDEGGDNDERIL